MSCRVSPSCPGGEAPGAGVVAVEVCGLPGSSGQQVPHLPRHSVPEHWGPQGHLPGSAGACGAGEAGKCLCDDLPGTVPARPCGLAPAPGCTGADPQSGALSPEGAASPGHGRVMRTPTQKERPPQAVPLPWKRKSRNVLERGSSTPGPAWPGALWGPHLQHAGASQPPRGCSSPVASSAPQSPPPNTPTRSHPVCGGSAARPSTHTHTWFHWDLPAQGHRCPFSARAQGTQMTNPEPRPNPGL